MVSMLPNGITPYAHQLDAAREILQRRRAILAFDVGLGKTLTSILVGREYQQYVKDSKFVILAPPTLLGNWRNECNLLIEPELHSSGRIPPSIDGRYFLVVDEAHYYQNIDSKRTKAMLNLAQKADGLLLMTATPMRNYPSNLYPLLKACGLDIPYSQYLYSFCDGKVNGASDLIGLFGVASRYLIHGRKADHMSLPSFHRELLNTHYEGAGRIIFEKALRIAKEQYEERLSVGLISKKGWQIVALNHLRQASSLAKSVRAAEIIIKAVENGHRVVAFSTFPKTLRVITKFLHRAGHNNISFIDGTIPKKHRTEQVNLFQSGHHNIFLGSSRASGAGINLQMGDISLLIDRTWSPWDSVQIEGRTHRNGQKKPVWSLWLQDEIIDPFLDKMQLNKMETTSQALYGQIETMDGVGDPGSWAEELTNFLWHWQD